MPSIEEAYASLQLETVSYGLNACKKGGPSSYDDRVAAGDLPWVDAARALALASHEVDCFDCRIRYEDKNERNWQTCVTRLRIEALGKEGT